MPKLIVKEAVHGTEVDLEKMFRSAFGPYVEKLGRELTENAYDWLPHSIRERNIWIALHGNELAGVVAIVRENESWSIDQIAVCPHMQGMGVGSELLHEIERIARENNVKRLTLDTAKMMSDLIRLYTRIGFHIYREGNATHNKDSHPRVYMEKILE